MPQYVAQAGAAPGQIQMRVIPQSTRPGFAHHSQMRLGVIQLLCGMVVLVVSVAMIFFRSALFFFGYGIWTGLIFIVAGALGTQSARSKNTCPIVGCLVMSVFAMLSAVVVLIFAVIGLGVDSRRCDDDMFDYLDYDCEDTATIRKVNIGLQATNLAIGLLEVIVAFIQMVISSRAVCCAPSQPGAVYYAASGAPAPQPHGAGAQPGPHHYPQHQAQYPGQNYQAQAQKYPQAQPYPQAQSYPQGQPYQHGQHYPPASYADQRGFSPPPQTSSLYPQLPMEYDSDGGRPPPYNPSVGSAPPPYGETTYPTKH